MNGAIHVITFQLEEDIWNSQKSRLSHSDPPGREQDPENKTSSDCVDKKAVNSAFKAKRE